MYIISNSRYLRYINLLNYIVTIIGTIILEGKDITNIRLAVTETEFGYDYEDEIFIEYDGYTDYIDEDIITVYGEIYGTYTYVSQAGYNISLPGLIAEEFE